MSDLHKHVWPFFKSKIIKPIVHETLNIKDANKAHEKMEKDQKNANVFFTVVTVLLSAIIWAYIFSQ